MLFRSATYYFIGAVLRQCHIGFDRIFRPLLNSQIAKEKGLFSIDDVIGGICEKMVRRHPCVFGGEKINSTEEGEALWARIKMQEKAKKP